MTGSPSAGEKAIGLLAARNTLFVRSSCLRESSEHLCLNASRKSGFVSMTSASALNVEAAPTPDAVRLFKQMGIPRRYPLPRVSFISRLLNMLARR